MPEQIPKTQKAIVSEKADSLEIKEIPVIQPDDLPNGQALVKVLYSGVCHTDLHVINDDWPVKANRPCIAGHEGAGVIVGLPKNASTHFKVGDRVGIKWIADSCNECSYCLAGDEPLCAKAQCSGLTVDGSFQQYCPAYLSQLSPIPDKLPLEQAAPILCAGLTVYKALKETGARAGQYVALPGAGGGLGSLALQYAKYMGLSAIAIDTGSEKKALCEKLGCAAWVDFKESKDIVAAIKAATPDGLGPKACVVTSPKPQAYEQALEYLRPRGTCVAVGLPPTGAKVQADVFFTVLCQKSLKGSYVGNRLDTMEALQIAADGYVKSSLVVQPMSKIHECFERMEKGTLAGRVVLDMFA